MVRRSWLQKSVPGGMGTPWSNIFRVLLLIAVAGCGGSGQPGEWQRVDWYRWREIANPGRRSVGFTVMEPKSTGIDFVYHVPDSLAKLSRVLAHGAGLAMGDVDGDGLTDVLLVRPVGPNILYRNRGDFDFEDITAQSGLGHAGGPAVGAALADVEGDGDLDAIINTVGGPSSLFINDGKGHFTVDQSFPGRRSILGNLTSTLADVDGDGDLDLYTVAHKAIYADDRYGGTAIFDVVVEKLPDNYVRVKDEFKDDYTLEPTPDGKGVVLQRQSDPDAFYLNDGHGGFVQFQLANSELFSDDSGRKLTKEPRDLGLAARFYDVNNDLAPDLYVANDFDDPDQFWINDGTGRFKLLGPMEQRNTSRSSMAVDFGDIDRDGNVDFLVADMLSLDSRQRRTQIWGRTAPLLEPGIFVGQPQFMRNTMMLNRGDGSFAQIAELAKVDASGWTWSVAFVDVDLDGYEDILTTTGSKWDEGDGDIDLLYRDKMHLFHMQEAGYPRLLLPNYVFRNRGDLTFEEVSEKWRFGDGPDIAMGMAVGDLDGDADLDVVLNRLDRTALVLRNDAPGPRVMVRLRGRDRNSRGVGAKVRVRGGAVPFQEREMTAGGLYLSSSDYALTFATGNAKTVEIEILWRDGSRSVIPDARPNREYEISQGGATPMPKDSARAPKPTIFADRTSALGHLHHEREFEPDRLRQPLLPESLAELGPGVAWFDPDQDGDDDLVVGTGRGGALNWYRNTGGSFERSTLDAATGVDVTGFVVIPAGGGKTKLLIGQASYEMVEGGLELPSVVGFSFDPKGRLVGKNEAIVGPDTASIGPLAVADVDGDQDLDLFVGGRVVAGGFPRPPGSRLFKNRGDGTYDLDQGSAGLFGKLGMVTSAVFSDVDGDNDPDLIVLTDWGPISLFLNDRGTFKVAPSSWGLSQRSAQWLGVATGDFDNDGRPDLVTTSRGRNLRERPDSANPVYLYHGNFDRNYTYDVLVAVNDERLKGPVPVIAFDRFAVALAEAASLLNGYKNYADKTVDSMLSLAPGAPNRIAINSSEHLVWLNRGDHFEPKPLPVQAQMSPSFAPVVADFDGDGHDDLALSQNFYRTKGVDPPFDAGRGLLLLGNGKGDFVALEGTVSGIIVYGDQRGAATADYNRDGRPDLVITQNGAATRLFENQAGKPGVRVRLEGDPANPSGVGATLRLACGSQTGPLREIQQGTGYWSANSQTTVLARPADGACQLKVKWPGGQESSIQIDASQAEVTVRK